MFKTLFAVLLYVISNIQSWTCGPSARRALPGSLLIDGDKKWLNIFQITKRKLLTWVPNIILMCTQISCIKIITFLYRCCQRLRRVVQDRTLWTNVYFTETTSNEELKEYVNYLLPATKLFAYRGPWNPPPPGEHLPRTELPSPTFTGELVERISKAAPNLASLILDNHVLDAQDVRFIIFWIIVYSEVVMLFTYFFN